MKKYKDRIPTLRQNPGHYEYRFPFDLGQAGRHVRTGAIVFDVYSDELLSRVTLTPKNARTFALEILSAIDLEEVEWVEEECAQSPISDPYPGHPTPRTRKRGQEMIDEKMLDIDTIMHPDRAHLKTERANHEAEMASFDAARDRINEEIAKNQAMAERALRGPSTKRSCSTVYSSKGRRRQS